MAFDASSVSSVAQKLADTGYYVLPVQYKTKAVTIKKWATELRIKPDQVEDYFNPEIALGLGILLGESMHDKAYPVAIDVDVNDPLLIERVSLALPFIGPAKKGAKGMTFFCRTEAPIKKKIWKRKDEVTAVQMTIVEILASGQQTVVPPSDHPKGMKYEWVGEALYDWQPEDLPILSSAAVMEIEAAIKKPDANLFLLNTMQSNEGKGGGDIHNSVLTAVAYMVATGWSDDQIWVRVERATTRALEGREVDHYAPERWEPVVRKMCADGRAKGFDVPNKKEKIDVAMGKWIVDTWQGKDRVYNRDGEIAVYKGGYFEMMDAGTVRHTVAHECEVPGVSVSHMDLHQALLTALDLAKRMPRVSHRKVCFLNGTFDMDTGQFGDHSHEDFLISRLPYNYDEDATCPVYDQFMLQTFFDDDREITRKSIATYEEFISHTLFECLDYHKFLVIKGEPRTGKSTLVKTAQMLHSKQAVSSVSVRQMGDDRFRTSMVGKLLNVVSEVEAMVNASDDFIKAVTAGDSVQVRRLYQEPMDVVLPTRLVIACNELFRVRDTSGAIEARMLIISCDNFIPEDQRDIRLHDKIKEELPGVFNRMVKAWQGLRERGRFDAPSTHYKTIDVFTEENNHVFQWLKEHTHQGMMLADPEYIQPKFMEPTESDALYHDFAEWAKARGFKTMTSITFGMKLSQIKHNGTRFDVVKKRIGNVNVRVRPLTLIRKAGF